MDNNALRIFERVIGPRLPSILSPLATSLLGPFRKHLEYLLNQIRADNPRFIDRIHVDLVDSLILNAAAYSQGEHEMVGLNAGVGIIMPLVANWLLSHPEAFPDIGDASRETAPAPFDLSWLTMSGKMSSLTADTFHLPLVLPLDSARRSYAMYITVSAWNFLLMHELAHINRCHLPFLGEAASSSPDLVTWHEFDEQRLEKTARTRRILEVDADGVAGRVMAGGPAINGLAKMRLFAFGPVDTSKTDWDWTRAYEVWLRAIGLLFTLMAIMDGRKNMLESLRTHPHADVRMQVMINFIWPNWSRLIPDRPLFVELTRKTAVTIGELFRTGLLPTPPSRVDATYLAAFPKIVSELWDSVHGVGERLNALTADRWSRLNLEVGPSTG